nr:hypothetical protein [uncultured Mediterranean phage uvMED]BAR25651.1 hypothetical protein [uncultured Mediterranean phage uvMED]
MAHFAEISDDGTVLRVIVVNNDVITDEDGVEQEQLGKDFCQNLLGGTWVQTSYNNNFRKRFASRGGAYDSNNNVFLHPRPYASWTLNSDYEWEAPVPFPTSGGMYDWSEENQEWVLRVMPLP